MVRITPAEIPADAPHRNNLIAATLNNPELFRGFASLSGRVHTASHLSDRLREIVVLRTVARLGADYEWTSHVRVARAAGLLSDAEIEGLRTGDVESFRTAEIAAIRFAEAVEDRGVDDALWRSTREHFGEVELLDLAMLVGFYGLAARVVLALDIPLDEPRSPAS